MVEKSGTLRHDCLRIVGHGRVRNRTTSLREHTGRCEMKTLTIAVFAAWSAVRHVPLPSYGKSGLPKLHNFINPEQTISSGRRRTGGLDHDRCQLWRCTRLPVQSGIYECESQIPDCAPTSVLANTLAWAPSARGILRRHGHSQKQFQRWGSDFPLLWSDEIHSLITGDQAVVTPSLNPLVAL